MTTWFSGRNMFVLLSFALCVATLIQPAPAVTTQPATSISTVKQTAFAYDGIHKIPPYWAVAVIAAYKRYDGPGRAGDFLASFIRPVLS